MFKSKKRLKLFFIAVCFLAIPNFIVCGSSSAVSQCSEASSCTFVGSDCFLSSQKSQPTRTDGGCLDGSFEFQVADDLSRSSSLGRVNGTIVIDESDIIIDFGEDEELLCAALAESDDHYFVGLTSSPRATDVVPEKKMLGAKRSCESTEAEQEGPVIINLLPAIVTVYDRETFKLVTGKAIREVASQCLLQVRDAGSKFFEFEMPAAYKGPISKLSVGYTDGSWATMTPVKGRSIFVYSFQQKN